MQARLPSLKYGFKVPPQPSNSQKTLHSLIWLILPLGTAAISTFCRMFSQSFFFCSSRGNEKFYHYWKEMAEDWTDYTTLPFQSMMTPFCQIWYKSYQVMGLCVAVSLKMIFCFTVWLLCSSSQSMETSLFLNICVVSIFLQTLTPIVDLCQWCSFQNLNLILICIFKRSSHLD